MIKQTNFNNILSYIVVIFTVSLSGTLFFYHFSNSLSIFLIFFLFFLLLFYKRLILSKLFFQNNFFILFLLTLIIFTLFFNGDFSYGNTYFGIFIRLLIGFLLSLVLPFYLFQKAYVNVLTFISFYSILFTLFGFFKPDFYLNLPVLVDNAGVGFRSIFIYFYQGVNYWNMRNSGPFWEGGAFASFISIALLFDFFYFPKHNFFNKFVLLLSLFLTFSSVGLIIFGFFIFLLFKSFPIRILLILFFILSFNYFLNEFFIDKFIGIGSGNERLLGTITDLILFSRNIFFGNGFSYIDQNFDIIATQIGAKFPNSSNSITGRMSIFGLPFTFLYFTRIFSNFNSFLTSIKDKIIVSTILFLLFIFQGLSFLLLFYYFLFMKARNVSYVKNFVNS